jgi:hypothetical protein
MHLWFVSIGLERHCNNNKFVMLNMDMVLICCLSNFVFFADN